MSTLLWDTLGRCSEGLVGQGEVDVEMADGGAVGVVDGDVVVVAQDGDSLAAVAATEADDGGTELEVPAVGGD